MLLADCCQNPSFTKDTRSQKTYCKTHFAYFIEKRVRKTIKRYNMIEKGDHIAIGYSGGKDSTVLLHMLSKLQKHFPQFTMSAITIDEGIDGYRDGCLELTKKITEKYQIKQHIFSFKDIYGIVLDQIVEYSYQNDNNLSPCAICGILRRRALNIAARHVNATKIATAHNLDDEAQSIVMNLMRGDSKKFIRYSRKPFQRYKSLNPRIRPLVLVSEPEIVRYALANDLAYHARPCPYAPSAMRNDIRAFLSDMEEKRPSTLTNIVNVHDVLTKYFPPPSLLTPRFFCKECGEVSTHQICPVCQLLDNIGFRATLNL